NVSISCRFRTDERSTESDSFSGQYSGKLVAEFFVLSKHITYFTSAHADISRRNVSVSTNVTLQFSHESLAETHDFIVRFSFRIKVRSAFSTAHRQCGQAIF